LDRFVYEVVRIKLTKAKEFLDMAELAADGPYLDAATSLAVSAAINASDALLALTIGVMPTGESHMDAVTILRKAGLRRASSHLARALALKHKAQYSARRCTANEAEDATKQATRLLAEAQATARRAGVSES
jgi:hypothetical protein